MCDLTKNVFEAAVKESLLIYQRKFKYGRKPVVIKLLTLFNYWSNQMKKLIAAFKIFLLT